MKIAIAQKERIDFALKQTESCVRYIKAFAISFGPELCLVYLYRFIFLYDRICRAGIQHIFGQFAKQHIFEGSDFSEINIS